MPVSNSVWIVIATDEASDRIRELVDRGNFAEAKDIHFQLKALSDKVNKLLSEKGGHVYLSTYDRQVIEVPMGVAEELPNILVGYKAFFGDKMGVGVGLDLQEASAAAMKSCHTGEIELYDPSDEAFKAEFFKTYEQDFRLPPNLFDEEEPPSPKPKYPDPKKYIPGPNFDQSVELDAALVNASAQSMTPEPPQMPPGAVAQGQEQPNDLLEALNGGKVPGHKPEESKEDQGSQEDKKPKKDEASDDDKSHEKVAGMLSMVQDKMPQLMQLADTNPEAFKKVINLVHKIVDMAKKNKGTAKTETDLLVEVLNKAIKLRLPVGTTKDRKKKVIINGKEVWRSMASGQVKDPHGEPVSVKSSNAQAEAGKPDTRQQ